MKKKIFLFLVLVAVLFIPAISRAGNPAPPQNLSVMNGFLEFPLQGKTPYNTPVVAIMDNDILLGAVEAYNGEKGTENPYVVCGVTGYKKSDGTLFNLPLLNYDDEVSSSGKEYLFYDNHRGYDYAYPGINSEPFCAAESGTLCIATNQISYGGNSVWRNIIYCPTISGVNYSWSSYHTFYIIHPNGYTTWYLHANDVNATIKDAIINNGYATVSKGQPLGFVGDFGSSAPHFHFGVRDGNDYVVDPYRYNLWQ